MRSGRARFGREDERASGRFRASRAHRRTGDPVIRTRTARVFATAALALTFATGATPAPTASIPPVVELIETRPIETRVGKPDLRTAHDVWIELIRGARRTIDLEHFYLSDWPGEPLRDVLDEIGKAAGRGVSVRLLLDGGMLRTYPQPADSLSKIPKIHMRSIAIRKITGGIQHAKVMLVDCRAVVVGSQNLDWRALKHIHEMGVVVRDMRVTSAFQRGFDLDWAAAGRPAEGRGSVGGRAPADRAPIGDPLPYRVGQAPGDTVEIWPGWSPKTFAPDSNAWDL